MPSAAGAGRRPADRSPTCNAYLLHSVYHPGRYVRWRPGDIPTIGTRAVLVSTSNQPDEMVYATVKAVFDNFATFRRLHPALSILEIQDIVPSSSVMPIHPGALKFYREAGLMHQ